MSTLTFLANGNKESGLELDSKMWSFISKRITAWKRLARNLGIDDKTIDKIREDSCEDKCEHVFSELKRKTRVTWDLVKEALQQVERLDIINDFEEQFC